MRLRHGVGRISVVLVASVLASAWGGAKLL